MDMIRMKNLYLIIFLFYYHFNFLNILWYYIIKLTCIWYGIHKTEKFYKNNQENEALICHNYDNEEKMNAYDFIVGLQTFWNKKFDVIEEFNRDGLSLFFKIFKCLYGLDDSFNNINVNEFINYIDKSCNILKNILENINL